MLDYSLNSFQRETFITGYDIDPEDKTIMVNYANNKSDILPYSIHNEKMILTRMRKQIFDGRNFYGKVTKGLKKVKLKDKLYKILFAILLGLIIGLGVQNILSSLMLCLISIPANLYNYRKFRENNISMQALKRVIQDYEKSIDFVNNSDYFSNEKVMKPHVIGNCTDSVRFVISSGIIMDQYDELVNDETSGVTLVDFQIFDNPENISDEYISQGYKDMSNRSIPFINENTISELSHDELNELYKLTSSDKSKNGKVLVKTKKISEKDLLK